MSRSSTTIPFVGFAAFSGTGKTTLLRALIAHFASTAIRVAVIKHAHHDFDTDKPGKDSYELRAAGASEMIVSSSRRRAHVVELPSDGPETTLSELLELPDPRRTDLILVEGFKTASIPKIELHRPRLGKPLLATQDSNVIAVASDAPLTLPRGIVALDLNDAPQIAAFIRRTVIAQATSHR
ncbi:MAG: molybdopterin-guanine dinucleotide biosynthesis protein B [Gammaproteobacteria bacterium]|nr:molybdopterin-guanine dinucleotide biosynthesis protein B [Gammaproteobacteria bacterium]